ncbi:aminotransferase class III-fold pyridoxal phosphate-dependent enzyme [Solwaraspora sp. WMMD406]|uniref:aminotransferase class III-fold pyridoxal phosphate-dependent enzyme n=1 Tax=Solwaraspora sp. WMMD406 TaxID=3016095 RepID=UPI002417F7BE|nr:aminotransferase class III-fold pyridoxal phosphate-dependent enzyme [Solwaraspora sp. WMMD406]MDG4765945.1 aminotransferase class III-fold pyridoxal phosphate-dependent enzyme [Solwaraspora sp. WMMD406]
MIDPSTYHAWHGIVPMGEFLAESDPGMFLVGGEGSHVIDRAGRRYLDARSSMWNVTLGYSCEPVKAAIRRQLGDLPSGTVMRYEHPPQITVDYAAALAAWLPPTLRHIRFGNTGSQMTEAAAMLSRFHRRMTGETGREYVVAVHGSYHGTGPLATALTGEQILHEWSAPLDDRTVHVAAAPADGCDDSCGGRRDDDCVRPLAEVVDRLGPQRVTAVIVEPVMGNYLHAASTHQLESLIRYCRGHGVHVIVDEVTTGAGRVAAMTVSGRLALEPDMIVLGKGLSAGYFPLTALAVADPIFDALATPPVRLGFPNGSTTDGHPLGAAAGLAVLEILTADGFLDGVRERGRQLRDTLLDTLADDPHVGDVRGEGMLLGLELRYRDGTPWTLRDVYRLRLACRDNGLLVSYADGVMPLLPPLTISVDECAELATVLGKTITAYAAEHLTS